MEDFYPMPMFVNLEVTDLTRSADWYQMTLGFRVVFSQPLEKPVLIHLRRERYQDLLLIPAQQEHDRQPGSGVVIQFRAGGSTVEEMAQRARSVGDVTFEGPVERPWNVRDVTFTDPDGYRLRFSEPIDVNLSFEEVMG